MEAKPTRAAAAQSLAARIVVLACAASAGAHAGLVPEHLRTEPRMGVAFLVAVALLLATGIAVARRPGDLRVTSAAALLFAGLIAAYTASRTTGIPVIGPDPESVDGVGVATNVVEALGLACALSLTHHSAANGGGFFRRSPHEQQFHGRSTADVRVRRRNRAGQHGRRTGGLQHR